MSRRSARLQELPAGEILHLRSLNDVDLLKRVASLFSVGWTLAAIGRAFAPAKGRSTIKAWVDRSHQYPDVSDSTPLPSPKHKTDGKGYQRKTPRSPGVPSDVAYRLRELSPIAKNYRARMPSSTEEFRANREMDRIVQDLKDNDVSTADIAKAANVTHRAIAKRVEKLSK
jgi:hypothetical protein